MKVVIQLTASFRRSPSRTALRSLLSPCRGLMYHVRIIVLHVRYSQREKRVWFYSCQLLDSLNSKRGEGRDYPVDTKATHRTDLAKQSRGSARVRSPDWLSQRFTNCTIGNVPGATECLFQGRPESTRELFHGPLGRRCAGRARGERRVAAGISSGAPRAPT